MQSMQSMSNIMYTILYNTNNNTVRAMGTDL